MKLDEIKALAEIMKTNALTEISVKEGNLEIKLKAEAAASAAAFVAAEKALPEKTPQIAEEITGGKAVKSPMVGVFYSAPSPEEEPFVKVGDRVKKGDVLCIVEAMKLMNEITAEQEGEIAQICVEDGALVEFGQTLFVVK